MSSKTSSKSSGVRYIVRRLPPTVTEEMIKDYLKDFEGKYDNFRFCVQPSTFDRTRLNHIPWKRFYIHLKDNECTSRFIKCFRNIEFPFDESGRTMTRPVVEIAPSQLLPRIIKERDSRCGTIYSDPDYMTFVNKCEEAEKKLKDQEMQEQLAMEREAEIKQEATLAPLAKFVAENKESRSQTVKMLTRSDLIESDQRLHQSKAKKKEEKERLRQRQTGKHIKVISRRSQGLKDQGRKRGQKIKKQWKPKNTNNTTTPSEKVESSNRYIQRISPQEENNIYSSSSDVSDKHSNSGYRSSRRHGGHNYDYDQYGGYQDYHENSYDHSYNNNHHHHHNYDHDRENDSRNYSEVSSGKRSGRNRRYGR